MFLFCVCVCRILPLQQLQQFNSIKVRFNGFYLGYHVIIGAKCLCFQSPYYIISDLTLIKAHVLETKYRLQQMLELYGHEIKQTHLL